MDHPDAVAVLGPRAIGPPILGRSALLRVAVRDGDERPVVRAGSRVLALRRAGPNVSRICLRTAADAGSSSRPAGVSGPGFSGPPAGAPVSAEPRTARAAVLPRMPRGAELPRSRSWAALPGTDLGERLLVGASRRAMSRPAVGGRCVGRPGRASTRLDTPGYATDPRPAGSEGLECQPSRCSRAVPAPLGQPRLRVSPGCD